MTEVSGPGTGVLPHGTRRGRASWAALPQERSRDRHRDGIQRADVYAPNHWLAAIEHAENGAGATAASSTSAEPLHERGRHADDRAVAGRHGDRAAADRSRPPVTPDLLALVVADDLTGAADSAVAFARRGVPTRV